MLLVYSDSDPVKFCHDSFDYFKAFVVLTVDSLIFLSAMLLTLDWHYDKDARLVLS